MNPMLATNYCGHNPEGWLISEKFDGVRAIVRDGGIWSREGNRFFAPQWFVNEMPYAGWPLDGELWMGRGTYRQMLSVASSKNADWSKVIFMAFDCMRDERRATYRVAQTMLLDETDNFKTASHTICENKAHLMEKFERIKAEGGEGVMIRHPESQYIHGRSNHLQKVKKLSQFA